MHVLICEPNSQLALDWARELHDLSVTVLRAHSVDEAIEVLGKGKIDALVLSLALPGGSAVSVADFAAYRWPEARVIFVTRNGAYADGSIFSMSQNASALLPCDTPSGDMAAIVQYHAEASTSRPWGALQS